MTAAFASRGTTGSLHRTNPDPVTASDDDMLATLERRLGRLHARQRLGIEKDHEAQVFGQGLNFFHIENATLSHSLIRGALMLTGLYWRGLSNSAKVELKHNRIVSLDLPASFDGFTILHLSDLHVELNEAAMRRVIELVARSELRHLRAHRRLSLQDLWPLRRRARRRRTGATPSQGPGLWRARQPRHHPDGAGAGEPWASRMLMNECAVIARDDQRIYLAGVDDAHFYRMDNIEKAALEIPARRVLHPAVAYAGDLPPGGARRISR